MKKRSLLVIVIGILIVVVLSTQLYYKKIQSYEIIAEVGFRSIVLNMIQLEGAIMFQTDTNWKEPGHVIEKVEDVIEGIYLTQRIGSEWNILSKDDEVVLDRLSHLFGKFPVYSGFPNQEIDAKEIDRFEDLRRNLREAGWGFQINYSSSWDELIEKAKHLTRMQ